MTTRPRSPRAYCGRSSSSIRAPYAGSWRTGWRSATGWFTSSAMMHSSFWLLISLAFPLTGVAQKAPLVRVEIEYDLKRNGRTVAEILERIEHGNGAYQLIETW